MADIHPKKSLGQHWLHDEASLYAMCDAANISAGDTVLEVGPGLGTLTARLLTRGAKVTAVEFDPELAKNLTRNISTLLSDHETKIELLDNKTPRGTAGSWADNDLLIVNKDILAFDFRDLPASYKVCANIPYYLTSHLIRLLGESVNPPQTAVLLVQKEVAERVCAQPGQMSILAATTQYFFSCRLDRVVPAQLFTPPPKVDSQILVLERHAQPLFAVDTKQFFRLIKVGFSEKRKTLRNTLSSGYGIDKERCVELITSTGLSPNARPQELALEQWKSLFDVIQKST